MSRPTRRRLLKILGAGAVATAWPEIIRRAALLPARRRTGTIQDVEHIVFLMQENRSFDHLFGTMRGVRGFGDPHPIRLPSGDPVWQQAIGGQRVAPFHPEAPDLGLQFLEDLPHAWNDQHAAWNEGKHDQWIPSKGVTSMAYLTRADIPFHYALADAFTVCDAYHCSLLGPTDPNRLHMWTGWAGNDGEGGGPALDNSGSDFRWTTFPERLTRAGITWKVYQDVGGGLDTDARGWTSDPFIGNYGDNSLLDFRQVQRAARGTPLYEGARTGTSIARGETPFDMFRLDVARGRLPQVCWIVSPEAFSEHPNWPVNYGAWFVSQILDALTASPEVWSTTALFVTYDENDGFFDHCPPPTPPASAAHGRSTVPLTNELFSGSSSCAAGPYGLGFRVPMVVVSPWSRGGWVDSEIFDHTSLIRFVERRFERDHPDIRETNITPWRRAVAGDLTSAFAFDAPSRAPLALPATAAYAPRDAARHPDYVPTPPAAPSFPAQEPGTRPARPLPYLLHAHADVDREARALRIVFESAGRAAAVFHVRSGDGLRGPWTFTVGAGERLIEAWPIDPEGDERAAYDLAVYGPNGFFRAFQGRLGAPNDRSPGTDLIARATYREDSTIALEVRNGGPSAALVRVDDAYTKTSREATIPAAEAWTWPWRLEASFGWYDLRVRVDSDASFVRHFAGHVETGLPSRSDPALGR